jgi:hypothetical protein
MSGPKPKQPRIVHQDGHCLIATFENVGIAIWIDDTERKSVQLLGETLRRLANDYPQGVGLVQLVAEDHPPLRSETRAELNLMLRRGTGYIRCSTVIFEGTGFRAAALRGIVAGLVMLARVPFPHQVFAKVEAAADWQLAHLRPTSPQLLDTDLVGAITALRARVRAAALVQTA